MSNHKLWDIATSLRNDYRYVDLTHSFYPGQPKFSMLEDQVTTRLFTHPSTSWKGHARLTSCRWRK